MNIFRTRQEPLNMHSRNLRLRLSNPPAWVTENPRAIHLINELTRSGYFRAEITETDLAAQKKSLRKKLRYIEYPLIVVLLSGLCYYYYFFGQTIENYYFVTNKL